MKTRMLALLTVLGLVVAACGGSTESPSASVDAGTGDYKITIIVGGTSYSKMLRIERVSGGEGGGGFFGLDGEGREPNDR